ncbi:glycosyltransferase [Deinococcus koreensis]|uniref:Glycosyltransferase 2-like domain-containing protein n=1 Tax=Deinococcus koreensis TaxID=2054903 RepID=A0A2K3UTB4_9DEIO|nr:glycosyltransferase [Deinococcus koreensis]PNY79782.1 hypothetical protein CVO96_17695 [Deinococcus koreensis]
MTKSMPERSDPPQVSVIIPTRGRAELLLQRALKSALHQTLREIEIIIVVDGPDPATYAAVQSVGDIRVRLIELAERVGGGEARNIGVRAARAEWIALLDDDDEWLPHKLSEQLEVARRAPGRPIVACPWIERTPRGDELNPVRPQEQGEALGDYLLARRTPGEKPCGLVSSLLMVPRDLLLDVPFVPGLLKHQDWDWLLRAAGRQGVHLAFSPTVAAVWYYEEPRPSVSRQLNWRFSFDWALGHLQRGTMSPRAFVGFLNSHVSAAAQLTHNLGAVVPLSAAFFRARPRRFEVIRFVLGWLIPLETRRTLSSLLRRFRPGRPERHPQKNAEQRPERTSYRIALIDPLDTGHHGSYALMLAQGLVGAGHSVHLIGSEALVTTVCARVPKVRGSVLPLFPEGMAQYYQLSRLGRETANIRFFREALRLAKAERADVIHLLYLDSFTQSWLLALLLSQHMLSSVRVRATLHWLYFLRRYKAEGGSPQSEAAHLLIVRALGMLRVRILVHSRGLAGQLTDKAPHLRVDTVPYFAESGTYSAAARVTLRDSVRHRFSIPEGASALLAFGGTRQDKGIDLAIRALALLPDQYHLMVVGAARAFDAQSLIDMAEDCGVSRRTHFLLEHVPDEDVESYFIAADCVILPYRRVFAGQSGPLLIAAALGIPVVASDIGVLAETVSEYCLGLLCAPEDVVALASTIERLPSVSLSPATGRFMQDHSPARFTQATLASYDAEA